MTEILVKPETVVCASHGEHLRAAWPKGFAPIALTLMHAALERDGTGSLAAACRDVTGDEGPADPAAINTILKTRPLCYFTTREDIRLAILSAGILTWQRCDICGIPRQAGPYDMTTPTGTITKTVCIECCLDAGDREHTARPNGTPR